MVGMGYGIKILLYFECKRCTVCEICVFLTNLYTMNKNTKKNNPGDKRLIPVCKRGPRTLDLQD